MDTIREVMTPEQVADYLQISRETVYRYIRNGSLRAAKMGRHYRVKKATVDQMLDAYSEWNRRPERIYTDEEIAAFLEADKIDDQTREAFERYVAQFE